MEPRVRQLLHPRYWPLWLAVGVLRVITWLPLPVALSIGERIGALAGWLSPHRRQVAAINVDLCFPERTQEQRRALVAEHLRYVGRGLVELALSWWASDAFVRSVTEVRGLEHVERARAEGRGVLLTSSHVTSLDLYGRALQLHIPLHVIYRENRNPVIDHIMARSRERHLAHAFTRHDTRSLIRGLRKGGIVWYPPDQDYGRRHSVFAPFFGHPANTITLPARLARSTGVRVLPTYGHFDGERYVAEIHPPLEDFPSGDDVADATRLNRILEDEIRRHPAQYYWVHRRFKRRPDGGPSPYPRRR